MSACVSALRQPLRWTMCGSPLYQGESRANPARAPAGAEGHVVLHIEHRTVVLIVLTRPMFGARVSPRDLGYSVNGVCLGIGVCESYLIAEVMDEGTKQSGIALNRSCFEVQVSMRCGSWEAAFLGSRD